MPPRKRAAAKAPPERVELPRRAVERLFAARRQIAQWQAIEAAARAEIERAMGDSPVGTLDGEDVVIWRQEAKRREFDRKAFAADHPELEAEYIELKDGRRPFKPIDPPDESGDE
jgi:hypothetical protein